MREIIRFAWGQGSLGDFILALSDKGIVALEFAASRSQMEDTLRDRFPDVDFRADQDGLADAMETVAGIVDDPARDCDLQLDMRGTSFELTVWAMLREIPAGQTTSYGALAAKLGTRDPRDLTQAIANNPIAVIVPCHRVIKKDGSISGYRWGVRRKRVLLARERRPEEQ